MVKIRFKKENISYTPITQANNIFSITSNSITNITLLIQLIFLWNQSFLDCLDKLSFTAVKFIRSQNNLALLQLFMLLGLSEHMLWIQSMLRVSYNYLWMPIGWIGFGLTIIGYVH